MDTDLTLFFKNVRGNRFTLMMSYLFELQTDMNDKVNQNWMYEGYDFPFAALMEGIEAVDGHIDWKWWAKTKFHNDGINFQLFLENVDILHFILSYTMVYCSKRAAESNVDINNYIEEYEYGLSKYSLSHRVYTDITTHLNLDKPSNGQSDLLWLYKNLFYELVKSSVKIEEMTDPHILFTYLFNIVNKTGYTFEKMVEWYIAKNALNLFRQDKGYNKNYRYNRSWGNKCLDVDDDNDVLEIVMDEYYSGDREMQLPDKEDNILDLKDQVYDRLSNLYDFCKGSVTQSMPL